MSKYIKEFEVEFKESVESIITEVRKCFDNNHNQQIAYSSFILNPSSLTIYPFDEETTQICFSCKKIRTTLIPERIKSKQNDKKIECHKSFHRDTKEVEKWRLKENYIQ